MNHQPYEEWILDDTQIPPENQELLNRHIKDCPDCFKLNVRWSKTQRQLTSAPLKTPQPGFTSRWQTQFALRQRIQERQQARTLIISISSVAGAILIALAALLLPSFSLISILVGTMTSLVRLFNGLEQIWAIFIGLFRAAPTATLLITGILTAGWISLATFAWGISIWRISLKGVKTK